MAAADHANQLNFNPPTVESYREYFIGAIKYIDTVLKPSHPQNLWLVIGATNKNTEIQGRIRNDLDRFHMYDFAINNELEKDIDLKNNRLITFSFKALYLPSSVLTFYYFLAQKLPGTFSRILFDWSTQRFIPNEDFVKIVPMLKTMLQPGGELYLESSLDYETSLKTEFMVPFELDNETGRYFLKYGSRVGVQKARELFGDSRCRAILPVGARIIKLYNIDDLMDKLDEGVTLKELISHTGELVRRAEEEKKSEPMLRLLESIFKEGYTIRFMNDDNYQNNPDLMNKVPFYFVVTRNLEGGGKKQKRKRRTIRRKRLRKSGRNQRKR